MMKIEVLYSSLEHARFYHKMLDMCSCKDTYHRALVYSLGICRETRDHIREIYDFKTDFINPECLHYGWQTGGSSRVVRLAFNLYCCCVPSIDHVKDILEEAERYTPDELFACSYAPYFWQAIKLRYPEYCEKEAS
jgi:hypothetical protein